MSGEEETVIRNCRQRLAQIDDELAVLDKTRNDLIAEQERLGLTIEAAKNPRTLNRGSRR